MRTTATLKIFISILIAILAFAAQAADLTWNTGDGTWDTDTGNTPWNPGPTYFTDGDTVTFESTAGSGGTISIPVSVAPGSTTVTGALDYTFTGAGGITSGTLAKSGSGTLTLTNGANSFTGITLHGGTVAYTAADRLGPGTVSFSDSATLYGGSIANQIEVGNGVTATLWTNAPTVYSGVISGGTTENPVTLVVNGDHSFHATTFTSGANTFVGTIELRNRARVDLTADANFGDAGNSLAFYDQSSFRLDSGTLSRDVHAFNGSIAGPGTLSGVLSGPTFNVSGGAILTNPANTADFNVPANQSMQIAAPGAEGGRVILRSNSTLRILGTPAGAFSGVLRVEGTASATPGLLDIPDPNAVVNWGTLEKRDQDNQQYLRKTGPGTLNLAAINVTAAEARPDQRLHIEVAEGRLNLNTTSTNNKIGDVTTKDGAVLGGNGTFTLGAGNGVTIESGGTLQGTLTVTGGAGVTVDDGGIVSPGDSAGTLSVSSLTLSEGSILNFDLSDPNVIGGGVNDLIAVDGDLTLGGVLNVAFLQDAVLMQPYTLFTYGTGLTDNGLEMGTGFPKSAYIDTSIFGQVNLVVIPEPASAVLLGLAGLILLRRKALR